MNFINNKTFKLLTFQEYHCQYYCKTFLVKITIILNKYNKINIAFKTLKKINYLFFKNLNPTNN